MSFVKKTALVNLRMPPSLKAAAQKAAADDRRSLTSLIEKLLVDYLRTASCPERDGVLPRRRAFRTAPLPARPIARSPGRAGRGGATFRAGRGGAKPRSSIVRVRGLD